MNRIDDWIESRLMNAKKNKSAVSTKDLIAEISIIFNLKTSRQSIRNLKIKIKTIIHELMHIPKTFGGGFKHHNFVTEKNVNKFYKAYKSEKK